MKKFREIPREVEAIQFKITNDSAMDPYVNFWDHEFVLRKDQLGFYVQLTHRVNNLDWVVRYPDDLDFYVYSPEEFEERFEEIE
jgi:hypothetical protein